MAREVLPIVGAAVGSFFGPWGAQVGFAIGSIVGNAVDPLTFKGPSIGDGQVQTSRDGQPIPYIWGIVGGIAGNIIQMNPLVRTTVKSGSKKSGITESEKVTRTFAIGIGRAVDGPIAGIIRCWENNKLIYDARTGSGFPAVDNTAFLASTSIYLGDETQLPDSELESATGVGSTPAYRGLGYIVFNNKDVTSFAGAIPQYKFEVWRAGPGLSADRVLEWFNFNEASGSQIDHYSVADGAFFLHSLNSYTSTTGVDGAAAIMSATGNQNMESSGDETDCTLRDQVWGCTFWFKTPSSLAGQGSTYIVCQWRDSAGAALPGYRKWRFTYNASANGFIYSICYGPTISDYIDHDTGDISLQPSTWYHVALTHDPAADEMTMTVSERGGSVGSRLTETVVGGAVWNVSPTPITELNVYVGRDLAADGGTLSDGVIDMLAFWDTTAVLTESEVDALFSYEMSYTDLS